ncbi:MAG: endonuclease/exonuclease/phosphatase family protein [Gemmatimonas sp.]
MTQQSDAHRAEFSVRCACGIEYHTNDTHLGKRLPCKCGRTVEIVRPPESPQPRTTGSTRHASTEPRKRRRKVTRRRFSPGHWTLRFGKVGSYLDRLNAVAAQWVAWQLQPFFSGSIAVKVTAIAAWSYLIGIIATWGLQTFSSEITIPGTIIAYGPRFVALWPLAVLGPLAAIVLRGALWPLAIGALITVFPIMGFQISPSSFGSKLPPAPAAGTFRVFSFNVQGGKILVYDLPVVLKEEAADVYTFQECGNELWDVIQAQKDWFSARWGSLCTISRWKIENVESMPREEFERVVQLGYGGAGFVMRTDIASPQGTISVVNLHLETARRGLEGLLGREGFVPDDNPFNREIDAREGNPQSANNIDDGGSRFRKNAIIRDAESERASKWALAGTNRNALVVAGDFNLPVESTIFRDHWGHFVDAFETKGNGLGWTKREGRWLRIRIDHLLTVDGGLELEGVTVGHDYRSDHLPIIADYMLPASRP